MGRDDVLAKAREAAEALARKRGHARVSLVHYAIALASTAEVQVAMARQGHSVVRLDAKLGALLAEEPLAKTYRDAPEPMLDPELATITTLRGSGVVGWLRPANPTEQFAQLVERLGLATAIAYDAAPVRRLNNAAVRVVREFHHRIVVAEHVLLALARRKGDDGRFVRALETIGTDPRAFATGLENGMRGLVSARIGSYEVLLTRATLHANMAGYAALDVDAIVVDVLRTAHAKKRVETLGIRPAELLFAYVHRVRRDVAAPLPAAPAPAEIVVHNDHFSTMEVVRKVLREHFGKSLEEANALMLRVHTDGSAAFPVSDAAAAAALRAARAECDELGMPLRIELRGLPAEDPPPAVHNR